MVRRKCPDGTCYGLCHGLCGRDGLVPGWTDDSPAFELASNEYAEHVNERAPADDLRTTQPYWHAGQAASEGASEGPAPCGIWGHDYILHTMGWGNAGW